MGDKNYTALPPDQVAKLKEAEAYRKKVDPGYVTAQEAAEIPEAMRSDPLVVARVRASSEHWPERKAAASAVHNPRTLPGGQGEDTQIRDVEAASLFHGAAGDD